MQIFGLMLPEGAPMLRSSTLVARSFKQEPFWTQETSEGIMESPWGSRAVQTCTFHLKPALPGGHRRTQTSSTSSSPTSFSSDSWTKKASPLSPSFICRSTGSPLISMSTWRGAEEACPSESTYPSVYRKTLPQGGDELGLLRGLTAIQPLRQGTSPNFPGKHSPLLKSTGFIQGHPRKN